MPALIHVSEDATPLKIPLGKATLMVGRDDDSNIRIQDEGVSKNHASIVYDDEENFVIRDNGSANGTFVNGERIEKSILKHHDRVRFGDYLFLVDLDDTEPSDILSPDVQDSTEPFRTANTLESPKKYRGMVNFQGRPIGPTTARRTPLQMMLTEAVPKRGSSLPPRVIPPLIKPHPNKILRLLGIVIALLLVAGGIQLYRMHVQGLVNNQNKCMNTLREFERALYRYRQNVGSFPETAREVTHRSTVEDEETGVAYRYAICTPSQGVPFAVVADGAPHAYGHNSVFQDGRMAIIPAVDFEFFWDGVKNGNFYIRKEWERIADAPKELPK